MLGGCALAAVAPEMGHGRFIRVELGFKHQKSLSGMKAPPGGNERSATAYALAYLLVILLLEPHTSAVRGLFPLGCLRLSHIAKRYPRVK